MDPSGFADERLIHDPYRVMLTAKPLTKITTFYQPISSTPDNNPDNVPKKNSIHSVPPELSKLNLSRITKQQFLKSNLNKLKNKPLSLLSTTTILLQKSL